MSDDSEPTPSEPTPSIAAAFRIEGRVQGVGYRYWAQSRARELGLTGYVSNRADGAVELHAEGEEHALVRLQTSLEQGPPAASVTRVVRTPAASLATTTFEIR